MRIWKSIELSLSGVGSGCGWPLFEDNICTYPYISYLD